MTHGKSSGINVSSKFISGPEGQIGLTTGGTHRLMAIQQRTKTEDGLVNFILFLIDLTWNAPRGSCPKQVHLELLIDLILWIAGQY